MINGSLTNKTFKRGSFRLCLTNELFVRGWYVQIFLLKPPYHLSAYAGTRHIKSICARTQCNHHVECSYSAYIHPALFSLTLRLCATVGRWNCWCPRVQIEWSRYCSTSVITDNTPLVMQLKYCFYQYYIYIYNNVMTIVIQYFIFHCRLRKLYI